MYGIAAKVVKKQTKQLNHSKMTKQEKKKFNDEQFRMQAAGIQKQVDSMQIKGKIARQNNYNELENKIALSQQLIQKYRQQMQNISTTSQEGEKPRKKSIVKSNLSNSRSSIFSNQTKSPVVSDNFSRYSTTSQKSSKKSKSIKLQKSLNKSQKLYSSQTSEADVSRILTTQQQLQAEKNYNKSYINSINNEISQIKSLMRSDEELDGSMSHISAFSRKSFSSAPHSAHGGAEYSQSQSHDTAYFNPQYEENTYNIYNDRPTYGEQEKPPREQISDLKQIIDQMRAENQPNVNKKSSFKQKFAQNLSSSINQRIQDAKNELQQHENSFQQNTEISLEFQNQVQKQEQQIIELQNKQEELLEIFNEKLEQVNQDQLVLKQNLLSYQTDNNEAKQIIIELQRQILEQQQNIEQMREDILQVVQGGKQGLTEEQIVILLEQQKEYVDRALLSLNDTVYKIRRYTVKSLMKQKLYNKIMLSQQPENEQKFAKIENVLGEIVNQQETLLTLNQTMHQNTGEKTEKGFKVNQDISDIQAQQKIQEELNNQYFNMYNQQINEIKTNIKQIKKEMLKQKKHAVEETSNQSEDTSKNITPIQVSCIENKISSLESQIQYYQQQFCEFITKYNADMELIGTKLKNESELQSSD